MPGVSARSARSARRRGGASGGRDNGFGWSSIPAQAGRGWGGADSLAAAASTKFRPTPMQNPTRSGLYGMSCQSLPRASPTRFAPPSTFEVPGREIASAPRPLQWQIERLRARSGEWPLSSARGIVSQWCFRSGHKDAAMATNLPLQSGGQLVVAALRAHGVEMAFSVAGESYLEVLDALYDAPEIHLVTCRQEGGAAFMAEAYGKLTGKPGVLLVTRGPGACNASIGVHTAFQDSTPMIVLVGQVARHQIDREAFQEVDFRKMYAPLAKWVTQIDLAERVPELLNQAFQVATSGRPGPVVVALPEDMLRDRCDAEAVGPYRAIHAHPGAADMAELHRLLAAAERPLMLVGGGGWSDKACTDIARFAAANDVPVCCSFRRQDIVDNTLPVFVGDLGTGAAPALVQDRKSTRLNSSH